MDIRISGINNFGGAGGMPCNECGRIIGKDANFYRASGLEFCCVGCAEKYLERKDSKDAATKAQRAEMLAKDRERRAEKEAMREKKKADKEARAEITSDMNLAKVTSLCIKGGVIGLHDFYVGKIWMGILKILIPVMSVFMTISEKSAVPLTLIAVNLVLWGLDYLALKAKRFTDGKGHTIRE